MDGRPSETRRRAAVGEAVEAKRRVHVQQSQSEVAVAQVKTGKFGRRFRGSVAFGIVGRYQSGLVDCDTCFIYRSMFGVIGCDMSGNVVK